MKKSKNRPKLRKKIFWKPSKINDLQWEDFKLDNVEVEVLGKTWIMSLNNKNNILYYNGKKIRSLKCTNIK